MAVLTLLVSGCGGGDNSATPAASGTAYSFLPPVVNSTRTYGETIVDNSNNTINVSFTDTTLSLAADGTYVVLFQSKNPDVIVNGTNYGGPAQTQTFNTSGQETEYVFTNSIPYTCALDPHGSGPGSPLRVGQSWSLIYTVDCNTLAPVAYTQTGNVTGIESVTVPAGTYSAIKLQSTLTWTDAHGTIRTQTISNWRDVVTSVSVKQQVTIAYSGTLPLNGYAVSREILLESTS